MGLSAVAPMTGSPGKANSLCHQIPSYSVHLHLSFFEAKMFGLFSTVRSMVPCIKGNKMPCFFFLILSMQFIGQRQTDWTANVQVQRSKR